MPGLNLSNLKQHKDEILKAEIGTLLFNLGKTHIGINNWKDYFPGITQLFSSYKNYYKNSYFEKELSETDNKLKNFIFNNSVRFPFNIEDNKSEIKWDSFFKGNALEDREEGKAFIQKIFFRGCENINSGIDKGSPKEQLNNLWISNAFGTFKRTVEEKYFDETRLCFFNRFHRYLEDNHYYSNPDWQKIRDWIFNEVKSWYSRLLSDSRYPVNDVTLFDQAYMTASMFKAVMAGLFLEPSKLDEYINNPQSIKWSILGIQYDKLGLAEKGLKAASIKWYRDKSETTDNDIKKLLEVEYALGNEVYRDETGIYFVVADNVKGGKTDNFYNIEDSLNEIKDKIQAIFSNNFEGEIYPAIFLTEPSRGLMNLGHLVEKAKENFLKVEYPKDFDKKLQHDSSPNGTCQICKMRLAHKGDKDNLICNVCNKRLEGRIDNWLKDPTHETIWIDELQDKNGRIALVTLKFELEKWLNGDLLNSLVVRDENFGNYLSTIETIVREIKNITDFNLLQNVSNSKAVINFIRLFDKNGIQMPFTTVLKDKILRKILTQQLDNLNEREKGLKDLFFRSLDYTLETLKKNDSTWISHITTHYSVKPNFDSSDKRFKNPNIFKNSNLLSFIKESFSLGFIIMQIYNILLERSIGSKWEKFIYKELRDWDESDDKPLKQKIDFDNRAIYWKKLNDNDIKFLSQILLQFLLRKNPSPARLRRIWETTKEFFEELESKIVELAGIKEERATRLIWNGIDIADGEYEDGELLFWVKDKNVYLISSIEKLGDKKEFHLRKRNGNEITKTLKKNDANEQTYKPYFTILSPTPISWQFIIPAENLPELIKNVQKEYYENFRWVYGKLPLHIGIVVEHYKSPLYIGIQALRKIRRDGVGWQNLSKEISAKDFKSRQKEAFHYQKYPEDTEWCENFYSLFEKISGEGKYEFYLYPETKEKVWIDTTQEVTSTDKFIIYPNTIDFEFLDSNTRRNDIYYKEDKRANKWKKLRPYDLDKWQYFEKFKDYFSNKKSSSQLQKLISLIYSKLEDWEDNNDALKAFMISAFVNVLELKDNKDDFAGILGFKKFDELNNTDPQVFKDNLLMLIDMFEFWHTTLKGV